MIAIINGNMLDSDCELIVQQVNYFGVAGTVIKGKVVGGGLAGNIRKRYPESYKEYMNYCCQYGEKALGKVQIINLDNGKMLANLYSQVGMGVEERRTDYDYLDKALEILARECKIREINTVGFPYYMGCIKGGGDWTIVYAMIQKHFSDFATTVYRLD